MNQKAIIYARFSPRPRQKAKQCESINTQLDRCRAYCLASDYEILAEHADREQSGDRADNRPGLRQAIDDARRHKAVLVVYSLSRLARNTRDALDIVAELQSGKAHLAMLDLKVDTTTPIGQFIFTVMSAFYTLDRQQTAAWTRDAMLRMQSDGRRMSDLAPFGMMEDPASPQNAEGRHTGLVEDVEEQEVIQIIVDEHRQRTSLRAIGRKLEAADLYCRGNPWHHNTIKRILIRAGVIDAARGDQVMTHVSGTIKGCGCQSDPPPKLDPSRHRFSSVAVTELHHVLRASCVPFTPAETAIKDRKRACE